LVDLVLGRLAGGWVGGRIEAAHRREVRRRRLAADANADRRLAGEDPGDLIGDAGTLLGEPGPAGLEGGGFDRDRAAVAPIQLVANTLASAPPMALETTSLKSIDGSATGPETGRSTSMTPFSSLRMPTAKPSGTPKSSSKRAAVASLGSPRKRSATLSPTSPSRAPAVATPATSSESSPLSIVTPPSLPA
jgi:hypothetical protein